MLEDVQAVLELCEQRAGRGRALVELVAEEDRLGVFRGGGGEHAVVQVDDGLD